MLSRAVRIFEAFSPDETVLGVSEIARRSGLHLATASRLVAELTAHGLLARDEDRRVRIGVRMWELALRASPTRGLRDTAMPFMEDAHAVIGHHVQLGLLDGDQVIFAERLSAPGATGAPVASKVASPTDFSATAARSAGLEVTSADVLMRLALRSSRPAGTGWAQPFR